MTAAGRRLVLTMHVTASVGWVGAVATSLVMAVLGLLSADRQVVRGMYLSLEVVGWYVLVPFSLASLVTGLVQGLWGQWGLLRHYWVLVKLLMNLFATGVLLLYTQTLGVLADQAAAAADPGTFAVEQRLSPVVHAGAALLLLVVAVALSVYKPRGLTRYGRRKRPTAA
jgi:hypothetical protein